MPLFQRKTPRTGNYHERENVGSDHSLDATYYKITDTIYMSR